jgi:hypothetical protein
MMKVTINELNSTKRGMEVEIPADVVSGELEKAFESYRRRARIPGFRSGKIPISVVKQRFGKQVEGDVLHHLIEEYAHRALEENKIQPIQHPVLDEYDYRQGQPFVFRTTFEVRPLVRIELIPTPERAAEGPAYLNWFASNGFEEDLVDATNVRRIKGHTELLRIQTFIGDRIGFAKCRVIRHCTSTVDLGTLQANASLHFADSYGER